MASLNHYEVMQLRQLLQNQNQNQADRLYLLGREEETSATPHAAAVPGSSADTPGAKRPADPSDTAGPPSKAARPAKSSSQALMRRPAGAIGGEEANPEPECARLDSRCRGDQKTEETSESKPEPEPEQKPEPDPCKDGLEEVCALLKPLLSGPELKIEANVRRRHAAVLAVTSGHPARVQHLIGVTRQCAERLRAEPDRCFTVVRGFLEQLDQLKIVADSAQSFALKANAAADNTETATTDDVARAADNVDKSKKANINDAPKASPSSSATVDGSAAPSEQNERGKRRHRRHVAKLEKTLRRLQREIVCQDKLEVEWDDDADSSYIVGARLKRRYVQVYRYYCRLVGDTKEAEKLDWRPIRFNGTGYPQINQRIEKFVNRTREFPDFTDVLSQIKQANQRCRLHLGPTALPGFSSPALSIDGSTKIWAADRAIDVKFSLSAKD